MSSDRSVVTIRLPAYVYRVRVEESSSLRESENGGATGPAARTLEVSSAANLLPPIAGSPIASSSITSSLIAAGEGLASAGPRLPDSEVTHELATAPPTSADASAASAESASPSAPDGESAPDEDMEPLRAALEQIHDMLHELEDRRQQMLQEMQQAAVEIGLAAARRLTWNLLEEDKFPIERLVSDLVQRLDTSSNLEICLHPADAAQLQKWQKRFPDEAEWQQAKIVAVPSLARGACRLETAGSGLQTSVSGLLIEIRKQLLENLADAQIERRRTLPDDRQLRRHPDRRAAT